MNLKNLEQNWLRSHRPPTIPLIRTKNYTLQQHQKKVRDHMKLHDRLLIVHGTGSGKTLTATYVASDFLAKNASTNIVIFVTPAAVQRQFKNSASTVLSGARGVYFTTYDNLTRFLNKLYISRHETFRNFMKHTLVIADEAHYITEKTEKARVFYDIMKSAKKVLLMTGTPIQNGLPSDLLPYAKILNPQQTIIPADMISFQKYFECKVSVYNVPSNSSNFPRLLPTERTNIPLTNNQVKLVSNERTKSYEYLKWTGRETKLKKGMSGWAFNRPTYTYKVFGNSLEEPKFTKFMQIFKTRPHKTIVFFKEYVTLNKFAKFLESKRIRYERITGKEKNKSEIIKRSKPGTRIVYLLTSSAKEGLDFKGVRSVIFMDYPWVPSNYNQIVGRARRYRSHVNLPNSDRNVKVYELAYTHGTKPTLNTRSLSILNTKRSKINSMLQELTNVSIEVKSCPGVRTPSVKLRPRSAPSSPRKQSPIFLRKNRVLTNNSAAINPVTGIKYRLENLNNPYNKPIGKEKQSRNNLSRLFTIRTRKKTTPRTVKTAQFSPKRGGYGLEKLFNEPRGTARTLNKRKRDM
jgi:superfamily II DNA or RNA helicase